MSCRILITGATGFVGFATLRQALIDGHHITFTARSEAKAQTVISNPTIQKLNPGDRLRYVIVPDITIKGAFDEALRGISHVIHAGSPLPRPEFTSFKADIFEPTVRGAESLLESVSKAAGVERLVMTTSFYYYVADEMDPAVPFTATMRLPIPDALPSEFNNGLEAYVMAKRIETAITDRWVMENNPSFEIYRVPLGWVFGHDYLCLTQEDIATRSSSNTFMYPAFTGQVSPIPSPGVACHIDDVATIMLKILLSDLPRSGPKDFGIGHDIEWNTTYQHAEKAFPSAAKSGVILKGTIGDVPCSCDCSETERTFGIKFKGYDEMVKDVVAQYLDLMGKANS